jgi:hypothetical protein
MSTTKINPESDVSVSTAITPAESAAVAAAPVGYDADRYDDSGRDIATPALALISKTGKKADQFPKNIGELVLGDEVVGETVEAIPVGVVKFFQETMRDGAELEWDGDVIARTWPTARAAGADGYAVVFASDGLTPEQAPNRIEERAVIGWLVIKPEGFEDEAGEFYLETPSGLEVAIAKTTVKRGSYRNTFKPIYNAAVKLLRKNKVDLDPDPSKAFSDAKAWNAKWAIEPALRKGGSNSWWEFTARRVESLSEEDVSWIEDNYSSFSIN